MPPALGTFVSVTELLVPIFRVADGGAAARWYERLGFSVVGEHRFAEGLPLFKDRLRTVPEAAPGLKPIAKDGLAWLDKQIAGRDTIVPKRFTLADVTLFAFLEFGATVGQGRDPGLANLAAWFEKVKARPSAKA